MKTALLFLVIMVPLVLAQPAEETLPGGPEDTTGPGAGTTPETPPPYTAQPIYEQPTETFAPEQLPAEPQLTKEQMEAIQALAALPREITALRQQITNIAGQLTQQQSEAKAEFEAIKTQIASTDESIKSLKADTAQIKSTLAKPPVVEEPSAIGTVLLWLLAIVTLAAIGTVVGVQVRKRRARKAEKPVPMPAARPLPRPMPRPAPGRLVPHAAPMPPPPAFAAVRSYLQEAIKTGATIASAREELVKSGWNPEQIDAAVREMQGK